MFVSAPARTPASTTLTTTRVVAGTARPEGDACSGGDPSDLSRRTQQVRGHVDEEVVRR